MNIVSESDRHAMMVLVLAFSLGPLLEFDTCNTDNDLVGRGWWLPSIVRWNGGLSLLVFRRVVDVFSHENNEIVALDGVLELCPVGKDRISRIVRMMGSLPTKERRITKASRRDNADAEDVRGSGNAEVAKRRVRYSFGGHGESSLARSRLVSQQQEVHLDPSMFSTYKYG